MLKTKKSTFILPNRREPCKGITIEKADECNDIWIVEKVQEGIAFQINTKTGERRQRMSPT